eukprot:UN08289
MNDQSIMHVQYLIKDVIVNVLIHVVALYVLTLLCFNPFRCVM